ncbi:hypothetical protein M426DRAFT_319680 [Hypoxylon sp. CI-4A]|nr:hypothetical protein M426DRAFT_319680 [Hypoxylon sp. CI-4A]
MFSLSVWKPTNDALSRKTLCEKSPIDFLALDFVLEHPSNTSVDHHLLSLAENWIEILVRLANQELLFIKQVYLRSTVMRWFTTTRTFHVHSPSPHPRTKKTYLGLTNFRYPNP